MTDAEQTQALRTIARRITRLGRETRALARGSQAAFRSVELSDGPVTYYDESGVERLQIGVQDDGTFVVQPVNSPAPPQPESPTLVAVPNGIKVIWDGTFVDGNWPADLMRVEIHVDDSSGYETTDLTQKSEFLSPTGGEWVYRVSTGAGPQYVKLVAVNAAGIESLASDEVSATAGLLDAETDGTVPPKVASIAVAGGIRSVALAWPAVVNADLVDYKIYGGTVPGFAIDVNHYIGKALGTRTTVYRVWDEVGAAIVELVPGTTYYFRVVAHDGDGDGVPSDEVTGSPVQITSPDIAANSIIGDHIQGNTISADKFEAVLALVSELLVGDRISLRPVDTDPDPAINNSGFLIQLTNGGKIHFPADGSAAILNRVAAQVTQLTVEDFMQILGVNNRVGGALTLDSAVPAPTTAPTVTSIYDPAPISIPSGTGMYGMGDNGVEWEIAKQTGFNAGTGAFSFTVYKMNKATGALVTKYTASPVLFTPPFAGPFVSTDVVLIGFHSNATRAVFLVYVKDAYRADGTFDAGHYQVVVTNNATGAILYNWNWSTYASWRYPCVFTDGTYVYVGATNRGNADLYMYRYNLDHSGGVNQWINADRNADWTGLYVGNGDLGATRYILTYGGATIHVFDSSGAIMNAELFTKSNNETANGIHYDGTRFWSYHPSTAKLRKYSTIKTSPSRAVKYTWHNIAGNIESTASLVANVTQNLRQWLKVTTSAIPSSSDPQAPDSVRIYIDAHKQTDLAAGITTETYEVPGVAGADSPGVDGFAAIDTFGQILSEGLDTVGDGEPLIQIKGDGSWRVGRMTGGPDGLVRPSGEIIHLSTGTSQNVLTGTWTQASFGLDPTTPGRDRDIADMLSANSSGVLINEDGWYRADAFVNFATTSGGGRCLARLVLAATPGTAASGGGFCYSEVSFVNGVSIAHALGLPFYATAGQHLRLEVWQNSGATQSITSRHLIATRV